MRQRARQTGFCEKRAPLLPVPIPSIRTRHDNQPTNPGKAREASHEEIKDFLFLRSFVRPFVRSFVVLQKTVDDTNREEQTPEGQRT